MKIKKVNHEKVIISLLILVSVLLVFNLFLSLNHINKYQIQKETGNEKWRQVELTLKNYDNRIENIERRIK